MSFTVNDLNDTWQKLNKKYTHWQVHPSEMARMRLIAKMLLYHIYSSGQTEVFFEFMGIKAKEQFDETE